MFTRLGICPECLSNTSKYIYVCDKTFGNRLPNDDCVLRKALAMSDSKDNIFLNFSLPIQRLMTMVYETLQEATSSSPECGIQLFYATRNIFEVFCSVVPTYHKEALTTLPQLAG